jgi:replicative DNA helicase
MTIEKTILQNLIHNEIYLRKVQPFLELEYFSVKTERVILEVIDEFFTKYAKPISVPILEIELSNRTDMSESEHRSAKEFVLTLHSEPINADWLINSTEEFCKKKALYNAIVNSISIIEGRDKNSTEAMIPSMMTNALAISFDSNVGHDYFEDAEARYEYYHRTAERIPFDIDILNKITKGGLIRKTLNGTIAESGAGKSAFMCHLAASTMRQGFNVLYLTMEMAEEKISERIDANMMKVNLNDIEHLDKDAFMSKIDKIKSKVNGRLKVKEFPTSGAHAGHFRAVIEELKLKEDFTADLIIVDYLNICCSSRVKMGASVNSYTYIKFIAEELRGLAVEQNVAMWTATQTNRTGYNNSDISMTDTSESMGLVHTLDLYLAQMAPEELMELNQMMIKQLKNRYNDPSYYKCFVVGFDRPRMTFYNVEESAQEGLVATASGAKQHKKTMEEDKPLFDSSTFGKKDRGNFGGFK